MRTTLPCSMSRIARLTVLILVVASSCGGQEPVSAGGDVRNDTALTRWVVVAPDDPVAEGSPAVRASPDVVKPYPEATLSPGLPTFKTDYEWKIWHQICDGCQSVSVEEAGKLLGEPIFAPTELPPADFVQAFPVPGLNVTLKWKSSKYGSLAITYEQPPIYANASASDLKAQVAEMVAARANGGQMFGTPSIVERPNRSLLVTVSASGDGTYVKTRGGRVVLEVMASAVSDQPLRDEFEAFVDSLAEQYGDQPLT